MAKNNPADKKYYYIMTIIVCMVLLWSIFGKVQVSIKSACIVNQDIVKCYVSEKDIGKIALGMKISLDENKEEYLIEEIKEIGFAAKVENNTILKMLNVKTGDYLYYVSGKCPAKPGTYSGKIIVEGISPLKYYMN